MMAVVLLLSINFSSISQGSKLTFRFLSKKRNKPVVCMCTMVKNGQTIEVPTDNNGMVDLTEYCSEGNLKIEFLPANPDFVGKYFHCNNASHTITVLDKSEHDNLMYNSFDLLKENNNQRYKFIAAAGQTELAHMNRMAGNTDAADSLESSAVKLTVEAFGLDKEVAVYNFDRVVLNENGKILIAEIQQKLGTKADSVIGPKTFSEAALIKTNWLYTNKEWQKNKVNTAISF